jgi:hypothetical protein
MEKGSVKRSAWSRWLSPVLALSRHWISLLGVVLVTTGAVLWLFVVLSGFGRDTDNPYVGILTFFVLPGIFLVGLALIPVGVYREHKLEREKGRRPFDVTNLTLTNPDVRRFVIFVGIATFLNLVIGTHFVFQGVQYMDSVTFCGLTCHTVMQPEYTAYQNSPHSRVACVQCHIGPGASWAVKSKISGAWQVISVSLNLYPRPIPTPVQNLRPARETCEVCHWPQKFEGTRLRVLSKYAEDESNSEAKSVLLMHIGGGTILTSMHGAHLAEGVHIRYAASDETRQSIPWVEYRNTKTGRVVEYLAPDFKKESLAGLTIRDMDCVDCHNRPSHTFELPDRAMNESMEAGRISPALPYAKKTALELLNTSFASQEEAARRIPVEFAKFYETNYPEIYASRKAEVEQSAREVLAVYSRNIFPAMNVTWGAYPNNLGHTDFPGCFRCHDDVHTAVGGDEVIRQDCGTCHELLAMEEKDPKILVDLGLAKPAQ